MKRFVLGFYSMKAIYSHSISWKVLERYALHWSQTSNENCTVHYPTQFGSPGPVIHIQHNFYPLNWKTIGQSWTYNIFFNLKISCQKKQFANISSSWPETRDLCYTSFYKYLKELFMFLKTSIPSCLKSTQQFTNCVLLNSQRSNLAKKIILLYWSWLEVLQILKFIPFILFLCKLRGFIWISVNFIVWRILQVIWLWNLNYLLCVLYKVQTFFHLFKKHWKYA